MGLRTFTFGGTSSSAYSMFITEAATYNVPERAVDMLSIPGRNGAYALDLGRFENVEVTYHVVVHKDTNANFQTELSDVRNWLASKVGYQRLTDDYNSNVYRMAIFKGGLETNETFVNGAEFDIVFECKPQRWLTSGETATAVTNNGTLSNPTKFDAEPLLAVKGYGTVGFNGYEVVLETIVIGDVIVSSERSDYNYTRTIIIDDSSLMTGDSIVLGSITNTQTYSTRATATISTINFSSVTNCTYSTSNAWQLIQVVSEPMTFSYGTSSTKTAGVQISVLYSEGGTSYSSNKSLSFTVVYDGANSFSITTPYTAVFGPYSSWSVNNKIPPITAYSTMSALGNPTYIDCDIGECWMESGGDIVSLNGVISLGSDLPKLASGTNTFTYDNTITELKVTPRWWIV